MRIWWCKFDIWKLFFACYKVCLVQNHDILLYLEIFASKFCEIMSQSHFLRQTVEFIVNPTPPLPPTHTPTHSKNTPLIYGTLAWVWWVGSTIFEPRKFWKSEISRKSPKNKVIFSHKSIETYIFRTSECLWCMYRCIKCIWLLFSDLHGLFLSPKNLVKIEENIP